MKNLSASEIVELGVQIEINGKDFYTALAEKATKPELKEVYVYLAGQETKHITVFENLLKTVESYQPAEAYPAEYFSYLNALASGHIFTEKNTGEKTANNIKTEAEALDLAIKLEKESITFYQAMIRIVPDTEHELIQSLANEEKSHLKQLMDFR